MKVKQCNGCGDVYPVEMVFEGLNDKHFCAYCLGASPDDVDYLDTLSPEKVTKLEHDNLGNYTPYP